MSEPSDVCHVSVLMPHPKRTAVLVSDDMEAPRLPVVRIDEAEPNLPQILLAIGGVIPAGMPVLRTVVTSAGDPKTTETSLLVEFEPLPGDPPEGWRWWDIDPQALPDLEPKSAHAAVAGWVGERANGWSPRRPQWSRPGWLGEAASWLTTRMESNGTPLVGVPQQHQLWDISAVLRAPSTGGDVFLKCSADLFRYEAVATQALAALTPALMPEVIGVEESHGWLVMRDFGAQELGEQDKSLWNEGVEALATIQRAWLGRTDQLIAQGLPVRRLTELAAQVAALDDDCELMDRLPAGLGDRWVVAAPALAEVVLRLDESGPGPTLVHGDFHPWNVAFAPGNTRVFDWTDAAVSHPFVDLATYVSRTDDVAVRRQLLDAYVDGWAPTQSRDSLLESAAIGMVVGALYQVITYRTLLATMPHNGVDAGLVGADVSWIKRSLTWHDRYTPGSPYSVLG